ncbi:hypothetical protein ACFQT0_11070 [Hymenobacter humi]|uniref:STAS/SEC14 domain-containing protein n=1 Tax=Hymenobacter humi TaxID=1411620 RepID=A0ABW2U4B6_9BACT
MISTLHYFSNAAAVISYAPASYIRLEWLSAPATVAELRSIYEHVLRAMQHHRVIRLMSVHNQRPPIPPEIQTWLTQEWLPRAVAEVGYRYCAVVEATAPLSRLAARAIGTGMKGLLSYEYFETDALADAWLRQ